MDLKSEGKMNSYELSQISNDSFIKAALLRLCERVEELEEN